MRVLIWSQHLLGTGHLRRSERLAEALAARGARVVLVNGGVAPPQPAGQRYVRVDLPSISSPSARFEGLVDHLGEAVNEALWAARTTKLNALGAGPVDAVVVELFPFGRRAFARELIPWLQALRARQPRPRLVVSLRDVLVPSARPGRAAAAAERCRLFDRILVHADPRLISLDASFPLARSVAGRLRYTGYVGPTMARASGSGRGVVVSAGGGAVGHRLIDTALTAAGAGGERFAPWTLIGGANLPEATFRGFQARVPDGVSLLRHVDDLPERICRAAVSVSQAGYNTVVETLAAGRPAVLVPFATPSETEQTVRAAALERVGAAVALSEEALDPPRLLAALERAVALPGLGWSLDVDGADRSAELILAAVGDGR
ncbi:MAG: glycosyltransferase [Pseudomonadota bacterium]